MDFSTDLVKFDTVFTTVGSATQNFRVYNPYNYDIKVDVYLAGGDHSPFSINVDGVAGTSFRNVEIPAKDSIDLGMASAKIPAAGEELGGQHPAFGHALYASLGHVGLCLLLGHQ